LCKSTQLNGAGITINKTRIFEAEKFTVKIVSHSTEVVLTIARCFYCYRLMKNYNIHIRIN